MSVGKNTTAFSFDTPSSPAQGPSYYPDATGKTPTFYAATIAVNDDGPKNLGNWRLDDSNPDRIFSNNNEAVGYSGNNDIHQITMWKKDSFLNGGDSNPVSLTSDTSLSVSTSGNSGGSIARFVIQENDTTYYVSDLAPSIGGNTFEISDPTSVDWFVYNPESDYLAIGALATPTFNNITGVGSYTIRDNSGRFTQHYYTAFEAYGVIPEPSYSIIGLGVLVFAVQRRRRRSRASL